MENAEPPSPSRVKKTDALRDLLEAREGFKAKKESLGVVEVVVNEGGHGYWDAQTLWCVGGMLLFESAPCQQMMTVWHAAKRGVPGRYAEELVYESTLSRACHVDEVILLQERALQDKPFALDLVSAEMQGTFTSKFIWKKGITGLRAERGDLLRVYRAKDDKHVYAEFQGYPGVVPASTIQVSKKVTKKSVTVTFKSLEQLHRCVTALMHHAPKAGLRLEPRTALLNAFGREGVCNRNAREMRSGLQVAFAAAYKRMDALKTLVQQEDDMLQDQGDKSVMMGLPRRQVMAKDLKNLPTSTLHAHVTMAGPPESLKHARTLSLSTLTRTDTSTHTHSLFLSLTHTPPESLKPSTPTSPLSRRSNTQPNLGSKTKKLMKFGACPVCDKHGQCLVSMPKYCIRCALKSVNENLNKGDLREATVARKHVAHLVRCGEGVREVTVGEHSVLQTRCDDASARVQEASRLNNVRDLLRAAHCGDVTRISELAASGLDVTTCVEKLEWVPSQGFLTARSVMLGFSAVHYACMAFTGVEVEGKKEALVELVERLGLDPHSRAHDGRLPMHIAVNEMPCLNYLIKQQHGNPEWRDQDGRTVLHHAALYGGLECRIFLIGLCDADASVQDNFKKTPGDYSSDIGMLVRRKKSLKMICSFFQNVIMLKCFYLMKKHKKDPPYRLKFVPTEERKQNIALSARVVRRRLYQDWGQHGHPRLLKPWSSLIVDDQTEALSLRSELSMLSNLEWSNALEWSWYMGHESPGPLSPCDSPVWEIWGGGTDDFQEDASLLNPAVDEELNMTLALNGLAMTVSDFVVHYDAKVVYRLETRPPTSEIDTNKRLRTPKDASKRTLKPAVALHSDGQKKGNATSANEDSTSRAGSMWSRVGSFTRAMSFSLALTGGSQTATPHAEHPPELDSLHAPAGQVAGRSMAASFRRAFSRAPSKTPESLLLVHDMASSDAHESVSGDNH